MGKVRNIAGFLCLVLYLCHIVSCNYFYHTHTFSWGKITHSHPYAPSDSTPGHTHTSAQCNIVNTISTQEFCGAEVATVPATSVELLQTLCIVPNTDGHEAHCLIRKGRSPPCC